MVAIAGPRLSRRAEVLALVATTLAALLVVIIPSLYLVLLPATCATMAALAPRGRRAASAAVVWATVSVSLIVGAAAVG